MEVEAARRLPARPIWMISHRSASGGGTRQQRPHEGPLVMEHAAALVPDAVRLDEVRIGAEQGPVLLIGSETGEAEQRQGLIAGPFGGQAVAVMQAAV